MLILGEEEVANGSVSVRARNGDQRAGVELNQFISELTEEINNKNSTPSLVPSREG